MAGSAMLAVGEAIAAVLVADTALTDMLARWVGNPDQPGIFDAIPDGQTYPLVQLANVREMPDHTFGGPDVGIGWKVTQPVNVWSDYKGEYECLRIWNRIVELLNFRPLAVTGFSEVTVECKRARVLVKTIDKLTYRQLPGEVEVLVRQ